MTPLPSLLPDRPRLEVALDNLPDALTAAVSGADRLEICAALPVGGVSPTPSFARAVLASAPAPVVALVRPRPGPFVYCPAELALMCDECAALCDCGVAGLAVGALTPDHAIDEVACARLRAACGNATLVFHRAFDLVADPFAALETLIALGYQRILTSGQAPSAAGPGGGAERIRALVERAAGRIEILPGGGIRADNAREILRIPGIDQIHSSCRPAGPPGAHALTLDVAQLTGLLAVCGEFPQS